MSLFGRIKDRITGSGDATDPAETQRGRGTGPIETRAAGPATQGVETMQDEAASAEPTTAARDEREGAATASNGAAPTAPRGPDDGVDVAAVRDAVIAVLKTVYDPEIPVDIYELGLVYEVEVEPTGDVSVVMTLTTPMCPVAETLPPEVEAKVRGVDGVRHVQLDLVWEPPWSMDMMSEAARLELNL